MGAIFVEEYVLGLLNGEFNAWMYTVMFTGTCMYLANKLGQFMFKKQMRNVTHSYFDVRMEINNRKDITNVM